MGNKNPRADIGTKNLKPVRTSEEARELGRLGGKASGKAHRIIKSYKKIALMMLELSATEDVQKEIQKLFPNVDPKEITNRLATFGKQMEKALKGDTKSFEIIRDTAGEKPIDKQALVDADGDDIDNKIEVVFVAPNKKYPE
jgi:hypothetical protein